MHEAGFEMPRTEKLEQCALGIRVAHDHVGRQRFTAGEHDAGDAIAIERDALYRRGETNGRTCGCGRPGECLAHRTHTAGRQGHAVFEGYVIELRSVDPYPVTPALPPAQDYTVTLFVDLAPSE